MVGCVFLQQRAHLIGKDIGGDIYLVSTVEIKQISTRSLLSNQWIERAEEGRIFVIPNDHVPICAQQHSAEWVVRVP